MFGLLNKFKNSLQKTTQKLWGSLRGVFGFKALDAQSLETLEEALYGADFGVQTTQEILEEISTAYKADRSFQPLEATLIGSRILKQVLANAEGTFTKQNNPEVICLIGINGAGKTTTAAKLAYYLKNQGHSIILGACDTFRAAANEQIQSWANRLDIPLVSSHQGADSAAVAFDTYQAALSRKADIVILDTAGRLHTKLNLMEELRKVRKVLRKQDTQAPHHSWLVIDASLGSNSIEQARTFHKEFGLTGLIITKLDGTSRGGALVAIYRELKIPIYFVGLGESPDDLQPFSTNNYVDAIFGDHE